MSTLARIEDYPPGEYGLPHMGAVIADHRIKAGWSSQEAFAIVCGVDKQTVAYWENQKYLADMKRRIFLCRLLKIPPALLGLTWRSVLSDEQIPHYFKDVEYRAGFFEENSYGLYEDILFFARTSPQKYSEDIVYRFHKHQQELEKVTAHASSFTQDGWRDLLSRYYQHSAFIAQNRSKDASALSYANKAVHTAKSLEHEDPELLCSAHFKRARIRVIQDDYQTAREDIQEALKRIQSVRHSLKGSTYLLAAEINAFYASQDGKVRSQCRQWQDDAANLLYNKRAESDNTFIAVFNLYAVHHERAKTLMRFALFHTSDDELIESLKDTYTRADAALLRDARNSLTTARKHLDSTQPLYLMEYTITEAGLLLIEREYEQSARIAKNALSYAHEARSSKGVKEIGDIYTLLHKLAPQNPYVCNLGVELGKF